MRSRIRILFLTCMLLLAVFLEMSAFLFLYESCPPCLLSLPFILTYWACSSGVNVVVSLSFIFLTGAMEPGKKRKLMAVNSLALIALLLVMGYAVALNF